MTDKERLEEIKEAYRWTIDNSLVPRLSDSDTEWLIEQAEKVERYEKALGNILISPFPLDIDDAVAIAKQALEGEK